MKLTWTKSDGKKVVRTFKKIDGAVKFYRLAVGEANVSPTPEGDAWKVPAQDGGVLEVEGVAFDDLASTADVVECEWEPTQGDEKPPHGMACNNCATWIAIQSDEDDWGTPPLTEWDKAKAQDTKLREEATKEVETAKAKTAGRTAVKFGNDWIVKVLVRNADGTPGNPKKPGTKAHARFACYQDGQTVEKNLEAGVQRIDLAWDAERNFIEVLNPRFDGEAK